MNELLEPVDDEAWDLLALEFHRHDLVKVYQAVIVGHKRCFSTTQI